MPSPLECKIFLANHICKFLTDDHVHLLSVLQTKPKILARSWQSLFCPIFSFGFMSRPTFLWDISRYCSVIGWFSVAWVSWLLRVLCHCLFPNACCSSCHISENRRCWFRKYNLTHDAIFLVMLLLFHWNVRTYADEDVQKWGKFIT